MALVAVDAKRRFGRLGANIPMQLSGTDQKVAIEIAIDDASVDQAGFSIVIEYGRRNIAAEPIMQRIVIKAMKMGLERGQIG